MTQTSLQESKIMKNITTFLWLVLLLTACQSATPSPITAATGTEFTLAPDQTATFEGMDFSIRLVGITDDERCPSEIECAMSGPVSLTISVQKDSESPVEYALQTFTSNDGRAPEGHFEGIQDNIEHEGYIVQVKSVLPYPVLSFDEIKDSEYQVSFLVAEK
jgi:hypothetical protein